VLNGIFQSLQTRGGQHQRWGFDLPRYGQLTLVSMLKALINDPGRYRLLALAVCKEPLVEKETPMTTHQVQELSPGPKSLADSPLKTVVPTEDFHLVCNALSLDGEKLLEACHAKIAGWSVPELPLDLQR
jgi:hypothetical protein